MSGFEREAFDEEIRSTLKAVDRGIANLKESAPTIGRTSRPRCAALLLAVTACAPPPGTHGGDCSRHFTSLVGVLEMKRESIASAAQELQMARAKHTADGRHGCAPFVAGSRESVANPRQRAPLDRFSLLRPQDTAKLEQIRRPVAAPAATSGSTREEAAAVDSELEAENAALAQELVQRSGQRTQDITALHQQMAEIAEQNQRLAHMLHDQNEVIDTLHQDAEATEDNVDEGNRQLQQAVSRDSHGFRNLVVGLLLGASACLLFLDWYS